MGGGIDVAEGDGEGLATGANTGTPDVFISYASQDAVLAAAVVEALERSGIACWIAPRDVTPGAFYADEIVHAIDAAKAIVLILSQNAADSQHVLREVEHAASKRHPVVSLRVDQAPLPAGLGYFLNTSQWLDASGGDIARSIPKLIAAARIAMQTPVLTPGVAPTRQAPAPSSSARLSRRSAIIVASLIGLTIVGFAVDRLWVSSRRATPTPVPTAVVPAPAPAPAVPTIPDKSVAVLPFVDMSEKKDQEYFADGMAEEIIDLLVKIPEIKVVGRTSSFQFKGHGEDLRIIGGKLGVAYVLEGSVRKVGEKLRVTAQLIDTHEGVHRWSNSYDRDIGDALKLQEEIAAGVVRALELTVAPVYVNARSVRPNSDAYDELLRGMYALDQWNPDGMNEAVNHFKTALDLDPKSGVAAAYLGFAYDVQGEWGFVNPMVAFEQARHYAQTAIKLDPTLAMAHAILAAVHQVYDWDPSAADTEMQQARRLGPREPFVQVESARLAMAVGHLNESLASAKESLVRDPLSAPALIDTCWIQQRLGHWADAEALARRALEISPNYTGAHYYLGVVLLNRGERESALREFQKESDEGGRLQGIAMTEFALGRKVDSDATLAEMLKGQAEDNAFGIAEVYAFRGEADKALQWLERAYSQKDVGLYLIKGDPPLKGLEADSRFKAFLRKMNLPD